MIGGGVGGKKNAAVFSPSNGSAKINLSSSSVPVPSVQYSAAVQLSKNQMMVTGGMDSKGHTVDFSHFYDMKKDQLTVVTTTNLPEARWGHSMALVKDSPFVVGGSSGSTSAELLKDVIYMDDKNNWETGVKSMKNARSHFAMQTIQDKLLVVSGQGRSGGLTKLCEYYDAGKNEWHSFTPIPMARVGLRAVAHKKRLFVTGGRNAPDAVTNRCDVFDPKTGVWEEIAPMNCYRAFHTFLEMDGQLVAMGGDANGNGGAQSGTVEVYDDAKDEWILTDFQTKEGHAVVAGLF
jgi:hypothetical protein